MLLQVVLIYSSYYRNINEPQVISLWFIIFSLAENTNLTQGLYTVPTQGSEFGISRAQLSGEAGLNPLPDKV